MGVLTDILVCDEATAKAGAKMLKPSSADRIDLKGFDEIRLGELDCQLNGGTYDPLKFWEVVYQESDEGPWIRAFLYD